MAAGLVNMWGGEAERFYKERERTGEKSAEKTRMKREPEGEQCGGVNKGEIQLGKRKRGREDSTEVGRGV